MMTYARDQAAPPLGGQEGLPLARKSVLIIEDEALIALSVETCLLDAGAAIVKIANSIASAQSALDEGIPFDAAIVDLRLADGNASSLIQVLSEREIPVVISTGDEIDLEHPALSKAVAIIQKPHSDNDLIEAIVESSVPPHHQGPLVSPSKRVR